MVIIRKIDNLRKIIGAQRRKQNIIGFVPTMGALHQGHRSLITRAKSECDFVVVSIFVNPAQFDRREDFKKYPRYLKEDAELCKKDGVDVIFYPAIKQMYPENYKTYVIVEDLSDVLCGKYRPGHFKGVATVVTKLFNIVQPDVAYFGQKDAQQAVIIKKMVRDLNLPVKIKVSPIVRQKNGLALSSRNIYLNPQERGDAVVLHSALGLARNLVRRGNVNSFDIIRSARSLINKKKSAKIQYVSIVDPENLRRADKIQDKALIALAVWIGKTRLIDNMILKAKSGS